jgi:hypothetical protein
MTGHHCAHIEDRLEEFTGKLEIAPSDSGKSIVRDAMGVDDPAS